MALEIERMLVQRESLAVHLKGVRVSLTEGRDAEGRWLIVVQVNAPGGLVLTDKSAGSIMLEVPVPEPEGG